MTSMTIPAKDYPGNLHGDGIVPDVLSPDLLPTVTQSLRIIYPDAVVQDGEVLERHQVLQEPKLELIGGDNSQSYTLIMTDPDLFMKNDKISGQVRHWLQTGIKFDPSSRRGTYNQQALTNYLPSSPPLGTGNHRYVFILCAQPPSANVEQGTFTAGGSTADLKDRMGFNAEEYIKAAGLRVVAVAWMKVKPDLNATIDDVKAIGASIVHKVQGK